MPRTLDYEILELAYVEREYYSGDEADQRSSHFKVAYLVNVDGVETILEVLPTAVSTLRKLPLVEDDTEVGIYRQQTEAFDKDKILVKNLPEF